MFRGRVALVGLGLLVGSVIWVYLQLAFEFPPLRPNRQLYRLRSRDQMPCQGAAAPNNLDLLEAVAPDRPPRWMGTDCRHSVPCRSRRYRWPRPVLHRHGAKSCNITKPGQESGQEDHRRVIPHA